MSWLYLWFNPCAFLAHSSHTGLRVHPAPGFPCALCPREGQRDRKTRENHAAGTRGVAWVHAALTGPTPPIRDDSKAFGSVKDGCDSLSQGAQTEAAASC